VGEYAKKKSRINLYVKVYFEGNAIEGEYDFDAVTHLKNGILKYLWTGKKDPIIIWNVESKSFAIIDPSKGVCYRDTRVINVLR
jgi:hypothetical protein